MIIVIELKFFRYFVFYLTFILSNQLKILNQSSSIFYRRISKSPLLLVVFINSPKQLNLNTPL